MQTPGTQNPQYPNPYPGQPSPQAAARRPYRSSDANLLMGLGIVLMCFGGAITHHHEVSLIGLAMIVFSSWID